MTAVVVAVLCLVAATLASPLPQEGEERLLLPLPVPDLSGIVNPIIDNLLANVDLDALVGNFITCPEGKSCVVVRNVPKP